MKCVLLQHSNTEPNFKNITSSITLNNMFTACFTITASIAHKFNDTIFNVDATN